MGPSCLQRSEEKNLKLAGKVKYPKNEPEDRYRTKWVTTRDLGTYQDHIQQLIISSPEPKAHG